MFADRALAREIAILGAAARRWPVGCWARLAALALAVGVVYGPVFGYLAHSWRTRDDYSHGALVPFIALYLAWADRGRLARLPIRPCPGWGAPILALAGVLLVLGHLAGIVLLEEVSLLVLLAGLALLLLGTAWTRRLAGPIAYLLFMVPLFAQGSDWVHWPFQLLAADLGILGLQIAGFSAYQEAQFIYLPRVTLEVAEACSGVRFLIAVVAIGIPLAIATQRTWTRRVLLVLIGMAAAILANGIRVALIGVWVSYGWNIVHGPLHVLQGLFAAWMGFIVLFVAAGLLRTASPAVEPSAR